MCIIIIFFLNFNLKGIQRHSIILVDFCVSDILYLNKNWIRDKYFHLRNLHFHPNKQVSHSLYYEKEKRRLKFN